MLRLSISQSLLAINDMPRNNTQIFAGMYPAWQLGCPATPKVVALGLQNNNILSAKGQFRRIQFSHHSFGNTQIN